MSELNSYLNENNTAHPVGRAEVTGTVVSIISDIVKKPRKPRMSSIVSKVVLLKQLSKTNLIVPKEEAQQVGEVAASGWS